ncbi:hypothetical protein DNTS_033705 [Danionella cerebrum]|uniref:Uncharacterized protein n=1 Tax=Danionella cerebrum TaxID=2873325 RepID=A0A553Q0X9_9TELE|nr:hypothetical protein DNTS_033705 [Danionella translucida]
MLELGTCSVSSQTLSDRNVLGIPSLGQGMYGGSPPPRCFLLQPQEPETWLKHRGNLEDNSFSGSLLAPQSLADSLLSHTSSFDALYVPNACPSSLAPTSLDLGGSCEGGAGFGVDPDMPVSPNIIKRRRGGLIEQRDIIKAHQAHKIQSTPQARRKEWEACQEESFVVVSYLRGSEAPRTLAHRSWCVRLRVESTKQGGLLEAAMGLKSAL